MRLFVHNTVIQLRLSRDLKRRLVFMARNRQCSLSELVRDTLEKEFHRGL